MTTKKLHYLVILLSYPVLLLHFFLTDYEHHYFISGILFSSIAAIIYLAFVYLFFKSETGKKIVGVGLFLLAAFFIFQIFTAG